MMKLLQKFLQKTVNGMLDAVSKNNDPRVLTNRGTGFEVIAIDGSTYVVLDTDEICPSSDIISYI
jgi:hypothetical protein